MIDEETRSALRPAGAGAVDFRQPHLDGECDNLIEVCMRPSFVVEHATQYGWYEQGTG